MIEHPIHNNLLQFETLASQESLFAFTTTIKGGVSKGTYQSFNLGLYSGDNELDVLENRNKLAKQIGTSDLYFPYQTHKDNIALIDEVFLSKTEEEKQQFLCDIDAIVTDQRGICIGIGTADCVPILIYDPINEVLATIHAGWRGTVKKLPQKVVTLMSSKFDSCPEQLLVGIGPSISQQNFEVGDEVVEAFHKANFDIDKIAVKNKETHKYHIDLWQANAIALEKEGIPKENIEIANLCTFDRVDLFFSARRQTIHSGRMITGGMLL